MQYVVFSNPKDYKENALPLCSIDDLDEPHELPHTTRFPIFDDGSTFHSLRSLLELLLARECAESVLPQVEYQGRLVLEVQVPRTGRHQPMVEFLVPHTLYLAAAFLRKDYAHSDGRFTSPEDTEKRMV